MNRKIELIGVLFISTLLGAVGQLMFKYAFVDKPMLLPYFSAAVLAYLASTVFYFYVLSRVHLSWAYSIGGLSYIFTVILAATVLMEKVPLLRWIGVIVITAGVIVVGTS
ncbi:MAG: EamA family transporter [Candidatus Micrarchaeia archaeon]